MGVFKALVTVELISGRKRTLFHLMKNGLYVYKLAFVQIDIDTCTQKFFCQQRDIKAIELYPAKSHPSIWAANDLAISLKVGQSFTSSSVMP